MSIYNIPPSSPSWPSPKLQGSHERKSWKTKWLATCEYRYKQRPRAQTWKQHTIPYLAVPCLRCCLRCHCIDSLPIRPEVLWQVGYRQGRTQVDVCLREQNNGQGAPGCKKRKHTNKRTGKTQPRAITYTIITNNAQHAKYAGEGETCN